MQVRVVCAHSNICFLECTAFLHKLDWIEMAMSAHSTRGDTCFLCLFCV